jgi:multidrug efflux pump subunit AcrB
MARTRPAAQVTENVNLFMNSLYEAIVLVVIIALIGFWDWRSALLMGLAIPITLFTSMAHLLKIDLQQVSIATLIIALGLLVDAGLRRRDYRWGGFRLLVMARTDKAY